MNIEPVRELVYRVILDRNGKTSAYEFTLVPSSTPDWRPTIRHSNDIVRALLDYEWLPPPGQPHGAIVIPPLSAILRYVHQTADGTSLDFPIMLDER